VSCKRSGSQSGKKKITIAVIPKGTSHEFWKSIHAGSIKAARELSSQGREVEVIWKGPLREDDREQQIQVVEGFTSQGVDGMVLAPLDDRALARPVEEAKNAGVPTVMMFVQSLHGISHNKIEDTKEEHLELAITAFDKLADKAMGWIG